MNGKQKLDRPKRTICIGNGSMLTLYGIWVCFGMGEPIFGFIPLLVGIYSLYHGFKGVVF